MPLNSLINHTQTESLLMRFFHATCAAVALAACLLTTATLNTAHAGQVSVSPLMLKLAPGQNNTTLRLTNTHSEEGYYQLQLFAWSQENGEQKLAPQTNLVITPPVALIPAGGTQVVRVLRQGEPLSTDTEHSYRLFVSELPNESVGTGSQVKVLVRLSLPVFVTATEKNTALSASDNGEHIVITNTGNTHAKLTNSAWLDAEGNAHEWKKGLMGYVLPNSSKRWKKPTGGESMTSLQVDVLGETQHLPFTAPSTETPPESTP